jgi:hypothetical protein
MDDVLFNLAENYWLIGLFGQFRQGLYEFCRTVTVCCAGQNPSVLAFLPILLLTESDPRPLPFSGNKV